VSANCYMVLVSKHEKHGCVHVPSHGHLPRTRPTSRTDVVHFHHQSCSQLFRNTAKMRRNHQSQSFKPFQVPSQRVPVTSYPSSPSQSRTEAIDQRLIEGSQQPRYSSPSPQQPFSTLASSLHDEDPELDAFGNSSIRNIGQLLIDLQIWNY
jgi:hypothetical protein